MLPRVSSGVRPCSSTWASSAESGKAPCTFVVDAAPAADGVPTVGSGVGPMDMCPLMASDEFITSTTPAPLRAPSRLSAFAVALYRIPRSCMASLLNMAAE